MVDEKTERRASVINSEEADANSDNESNDTDIQKSKTDVGKRTRGRRSVKPSTNAARERSRVQNLKQAFLELQKALPNVPSGTKLSKLDILLLATNYISHLMSKLSNGHLKQHLSRLKDTGTLHPIKKWPMRSRLYVSDPMWLYRSGRQQHGMTSQSFDSSSSSSMISSEEEENSQTLETNDLQSPSESRIDDRESMMIRRRPACRGTAHGNGASQIDLSCSYPRPLNSHSNQYQNINFQNISCVFQNIIPDLRGNDH